MELSMVASLALWAIGFGFVIASILVSIRRLIRYRYRGHAQVPWIRGGGWFVLGASCISVAVALLDGESAAITFWRGFGPVVLVGLVVALYVRQRSREL